MKHKDCSVACATFAAGAIVMKHNFGSLEGSLLAWLGLLTNEVLECLKKEDVKNKVATPSKKGKRQSTLMSHRHHTIRRLLDFVWPSSGLCLQCFFQTALHWAGWCPVISPHCVDNILAFGGRMGWSTIMETFFFKRQFPTVFFILHYVW